MTTSLFVLLRVRLLSERERVQNRGETTTRCCSRGERDVSVELLQRLSLSFAVGSRCDDIDAFASVSTYRDSVKSSISLCKGGTKKTRQGMCRFEWFYWDWSDADRGRSIIEIGVEQRND